MNIGQCEWGEIPVTCKCNCVAGGDTLKNHQTLTENTRLLTENITLRRELAEARQEIADRKADCETGHDQDEATIAELRQQLKHMTDEYHAALDAEQVRYRQVVEKDAEIERLRGMVDEIQAARHVHREHNRLLTNLASSQAREQHVMCVVEQVALALDAYFSYERGLDQYIEELNGLYKESQDTTALEAMIAKAGEVMRERCLSEFWHEMSQSEVEVFIRALPAVTLDDLKGGA